jgi:hypothetical protein
MDVQTLARHLSAVGLRTALANYWTDPRYEETFGTLVSLLIEDKRFSEVEHVIRWLFQYGVDAHRTNPITLWEKGRSPTMTALHALGRAGVALEIPEAEGLLEFLWETITGKEGGQREIL